MVYRSMKGSNVFLILTPSYEHEHEEVVGVL